MFEITVKELEGGKAELYIDNDLVDTYVTDNVYRLAETIQNDNSNIDVWVYNLEAQREVEQLIEE